MKPRSPAFVIGLIASIIIGFGIVAGVWLVLSSISGLGSESGVFRATRTGPNSATLELSTYPDAHVCHADAGNPQVNWVTYCSGTNDLATKLEVPPNSVITVVIKQYDSSTSLINDYFGQVRGTIGGVAMLNGKPFTQVSADAPGHTFTLQSTPNSPYPIFVSVPLVGIPNNAPTPVNINGNMYGKPNVISFQFHTGPAGITYLWHCYDPCGDTQYARKPPFGFSGPMGTLGYMAGMVSVTNY
jgi:hypothetical protein